MDEVTALLNANLKAKLGLRAYIEVRNIELKRLSSAGRRCGVSGRLNWSGCSS